MICNIKYLYYVSIHLKVKKENAEDLKNFCSFYVPMTFQHKRRPCLSSLHFTAYLFGSTQFRTVFLTSSIYSTTLLHFLTTESQTVLKVWETTPQTSEPHYRGCK